MLERSREECLPARRRAVPLTENELIGGADGEESAVVPGSRPQQPTKQREHEIDLHRHEQEVEVVTGGAGEQVTAERNVAVVGSRCPSAKK